MELSDKQNLFFDLSVRLSKGNNPTLVCDPSGKLIGTLKGLSCFIPEETFLAEIELEESKVICTYKIEDIRPLVYPRPYFSDELFQDHKETLGRDLPKELMEDDGKIFNSSVFIFLWTISRGFDTLGLISKGLAIDKNKWINIKKFMKY